jgi:hypothetical protein
MHAQPFDGIVALIAVGVVVIIFAGLSRFTRYSRPQVRASLAGYGDIPKAIGTFGSLILGVAAFFGLIRIVMFAMGY